MEDVLDRKDDRGAQLGQNPITVVVLRQETGKSRSRHVCRNRLGIEALSGRRDRIRVNVGGEDLQFDLPLRRRDFFAEQHGERISFLACAAPGDPDAQRLIDGMVADQIRDDFFAQNIEHRGISEEAGDVDEQIRGKAIELFFIASQNIEIPLHFISLDRRHRHAALDPSPQRALLVESEIVARFFPEEIDDLG